MRLIISCIAQNSHLPYATTETRFSVRNSGHFKPTSTHIFAYSQQEEELYGCPTAGKAEIVTLLNNAVTPGEVAPLETKSATCPCV